ncbi:CiaD-like domain-containing protein [Helicobacter suis]
MFEGLKAPQTKNISMKLDLVINYLQYQLYMIEERLKAYED